MSNILSRVTPLPNLYGISLVQSLSDQDAPQKPPEFLYWEFHEGGLNQAAFYQGRWKEICSGGPEAPVHLFDQANGIAEKTDVASQHPEIAEKLSAYLKTARTPPTSGSRNGSLPKMLRSNLLRKL